MGDGGREEGESGGYGVGGWPDAIDEVGEIFEPGATGGGVDRGGGWVVGFGGPGLGCITGEGDVVHYAGELVSRWCDKRDRWNLLGCAVDNFFVRFLENVRSLLVPGTECCLLLGTFHQQSIPISAIRRVLNGVSI